MLEYCYRDFHLSGCICAAGTLVSEPTKDLEQRRQRRQRLREHQENDWFNKQNNDFTPARSGIQLRKISQHLTHVMRWNNVDEI